MPETLKGKSQVDRETHTVTCPHCRKRFQLTVRVYQAVESVIVNRVVSAIRKALGKTKQAKAVEKRVREVMS